MWIAYEALVKETLQLALVWYQGGCTYHRAPLSDSREMVRFSFRKYDKGRRDTGRGKPDYW